MNNAAGEAQHIVLLGGTSDIGLAIVRALRTGYTRRISLACRDLEAGEAAAASLRSATCSVEVIEFDGADPASHPGLIASIAEKGDIDVAIVAFAQLGGPATACDPLAAASLATVNFTGNVSSIVAVGEQMRRQGRGAIVVLGSVAGQRVRAANPVYGATKAGIDGLCQGLGDTLAADGVHLMVVRPGFVHSSMTAGMAPSPFATSPEAVAEVAIAGLRRGRRVVWSPPVLRYVFSVLRVLPAPLWHLIGKD